MSVSLSLTDEEIYRAFIVKYEAALQDHYGQYLSFVEGREFPNIYASYQSAVALEGHKKGHFVREYRGVNPPPQEL